MKYRHRVSVFLFFLAIITFVDRVCISVVGNAMRADLQLSATQWGWMMGVFSLAYGMFELPVGALADRVGPRRVLTRIVACWSLLTVLTGAVWSYWQLLIVRFLFGAGEAGAFPGSSAAISRWFPVRERARAQSIVFMGSRLGGAITPVLVIPLLHAYGWRACFYIFGIAGLLWPVLWYRWFRDRPADKAGIGKDELREIESTAPPAVVHKLPWTKLLGQRPLWWVMAMYFGCCWTAFFYLSWLHTFLENSRGFTREDMANWSWLPFVFGAAAALLGGFTSDALSKRVGLKWGRRLVGLVGLGSSSIFIAATYFTEDKIWTIVFLALGYAGADFMLPVAWAVCLDIGGRHAGAVAGVMNTAGQAGAFATSIVFGYIVAHTGNYNLPLIPMAVLTGLAACLWLKIDPTKPLLNERG